MKKKTTRKKAPKRFNLLWTPMSLKKLNNKTLWLSLWMVMSMKCRHLNTQKVFMALWLRKSKEHKTKNLSTLSIFNNRCTNNSSSQKNKAKNELSMKLFKSIFLQLKNNGNSFFLNSHFTKLYFKIFKLYFIYVHSNFNSVVVYVCFLLHLTLQPV